MFFRKTATALTVLLAGCTGTTGLVNLDAVGTLDGGVPAEAGPPVDDGSGDAAAAPVSTAPGDAAPPDSAGPVESGTADGSAGSATPDGGCVDITVTDDAGPTTCTFAPADLACNTADDCRPYEIPVCACASVPVIGVNRAAAVACVAPHCLPPSVDSGCFGPGSYQGQDCVVVGSPAEIAVDCVNGRCFSQAAMPGH
jgi:hypothetical protein